MRTQYICLRCHTATEDIHSFLQSCHTAAKIDRRFWSRVDKNGPIPTRFPELGPCWERRHSFDGQGYGYFWIGGQNIKAATYAWESINGPIPPRMTGYNGKDGRTCLCHRCDNTSCIRPSHLFLDTYAGNSRDMVDKGRAASGERNGSRLYPERLARGETNFKAKLLPEQIVAIRERYAAGESQTALASAFGINQTTISTIVLRKTWQHVE